MIDLTPLHTFGLPASAQNIIDIADTSVADSFGQWQTEPWILLGQGSNSVFIEDFEGTVYRITSKGKQVEELADSYRLTVNAGENWHQLVIFCLQNNLPGFENLALIPGTVGAAPIQNIGAYGVELERFIEAVECISLEDGKTFQLTRKECHFGYRDSVFKSQLANQVLISRVIFRLPKQWQAVQHYGELASLDSPNASQIYHKVVEIRTAKLPDPIVTANAGSFFKNPLVSRKHLAALQCDWHDIPFYEVNQQCVKVPAAWLIDKQGFKGRREGGIQCHPSQPLVLTNDGTGTGAQLLSLAREIRAQIEQTFSIRLENEVRLIGRQGAISL